MMGSMPPPSPPLRPLRVALLSPCYWPEVRRGTERFVRELADGLLAAGQRPQLITSHPGRPSRRLEQGLPVLRLPRPPQGPLVRRRVMPFLTHVPLSRLALSAGSFDLAHAVYPADALAAAGWARRHGRPSVFSHMGIPDEKGLREFRGGGRVQRGAARCDAVVALSHHAAAALRRTLGVDARVIPPGVDLQSFRPGPGRAEAPTFLCAAAAEVPRKGVALLVEAFALVRRELPGARLILSRPRDPGAAAACGVPATAPGLEWRALDDTAALAAACREAWVAVLPSVDEAFGLVLAEAMACGTPAVGSADAAIPEVIDRPGVGRLFATRRPRALAEALLDALELARQPGTAAACRARAQELSRERCAARYLELYRELGG